MPLTCWSNSKQSRYSRIMSTYLLFFEYRSTVLCWVHVCCIFIKPFLISYFWFSYVLYTVMLDLIIFCQSRVLTFRQTRRNYSNPGRTFSSNCTGWEHATERIQFKLAILEYKCLHGTAPSYLADELEYTADFEARRRLRSASSLSLNFRRIRLSTVGHRVFLAAAVCTWNSLPQHATSRPHPLCLFSEVPQLQGFPL